jgi:hypothetical protein
MGALAAHVAFGFVGYRLLEIADYLSLTIGRCAGVQPYEIRRFLFRPAGLGRTFCRAIGASTASAGPW